jgi:citrate lyase subunit beta / citryl-CoA lyase
MGTTTARSWFVVPGDRPEQFGEPAAHGAHALICDLEDLVGPDKKEVARRAVVEWLAGHQAYVRINAADSEWYADDLTALSGAPGLQGVVLPKAEDPVKVATTAAALPARARMLPLLESAAGVQIVSSIAAVPRVGALVFGSLDFGLDLGIDGSAPADDLNLLYARSRMVIASRAAGIAAPIDGVTTDLDHPESAASDASVARRMGFSGKLCTDPRQIAGVNAAFAPSEDELDWARRVLALMDGANGEVVLRLDGQLIDKPVVSRAQRILAEAEQ